MKEVTHNLSDKRLWLILLAMLLVCVFSVHRDSGKIKHNLPDSDLLLTADEYAEYLKNIGENADSILLLGNEDEDSFTYRNINKTVADHKGLEIISWEDERTGGLILFFDNRVIPWLVAMFAALLAVRIYDERKSGLWLLKRSCKNGRKRSAGNMLISGVAWIAVAQILLTITTLITSIMLKGSFDPFIPIQAVPGHNTIALRVSVATYVLLSAVANSLGACIVFAVTYLLLLWLKKEVLTLLLAGIFIAGQAWIFEKIKINSSLAAAKYINIWSLLSHDFLFKNYDNLDLFGFPADRHVFCIALGAILIAGLFCMIVLISAAQYPHVSSEKDHLGKISHALSAFWYRGGYKKLEHLKLLDIKAGIMFALLFAYMAYESAGSSISYGSREAYMNSLYTKMESMQTDDAQEYLTEEREHVAAEIDRYKKELTAASSEAETGPVKEMIDHLEKKEDVIDELTVYVQRLKRDSDNGLDVKITNDIGYSYLFTVSDKREQMDVTIILLAFITFVSSAVMPYENFRRMDVLVRTSEKRRMTFLRDKILALSLWIGSAVLITDLAIIFRVGRTIGLNGLGLNIRSLRMFQESGVNVKVWLFMVIIILMGLAMAIAISAFITVLTYRIKKVSLAAAVMGIFILSGPILYMLGIKVAEPFCINKLLCIYTRAGIWS